VFTDAVDRVVGDAVDRTSRPPDARDCFDVEDVIAEVDAELAARKAASGGRDGT
jgi:hypothetical protein